MYEVYMDGKLLYYPGDKVCALNSALLHTKLNESGSFEITVPAENYLYDAFKRRISELTVYKDGQEIWNGEVRSENKNLRQVKKIYAVGELAYLNDSSQPQKEYKNITPLQMLTYLLNEHNAKVEKRKQFTVGMVTVGNYSYDWITDYENTLDYIRTEMCENLDGYLRIRKVDGIRYLDLVRLEDYGLSCEQPISFGKNLLDFMTDIEADSIATVIRPLGAKLESSSIEGVDAYLTIEAANDGKDYIENTDAINSGIGYVWRTVHFNVLKDTGALLAAGRNWLQSKQFENMTITVTAVDLSVLNADIQSFELGYSVRTIAKPFGMDKWSYITEKKVDLLHPTVKHNISIGEYARKSYTQQIVSEQHKIESKIPKQSDVLELAKKNASEIIKNATEGNIYFIYDENGIPKEFLIMDTPDINAAKKVWRWNLNGLGYSNTGYNGTFGLALTMDGAIVADFITSGTMYADRIKGGILKLGGSNNENGVLEVLDKDGNVVGKWDKDGITLPSGTSIKWSQISDGNTQTTKIIENTVTTAFVNALKVTADKVAAENITGTTISGKTIDGGEIIMQGDDGSLFHVYNNSNVDITGLVTILSTYLSNEWENKDTGIVFKYQNRLGDITEGTVIGLFEIKTNTIETVNLTSKYLSTGKNGIKITGKTEMDDVTTKHASCSEIKSEGKVFTQSDRECIYSGDNQIKSFSVGTEWEYLHVDTIWSEDQKPYTYGITWWQSDSRLKDNVKDSVSSGLDLISRIKHRQFDWKDKRKEQKHVAIGYVAQELQELDEGLVFVVKQPEGAEYDELLQVDETRLLPYLTKGIQELHDLVQMQEKRIKLLEEKVGIANE